MQHCSVPCQSVIVVTAHRMIFQGPEKDMCRLPRCIFRLSETSDAYLEIVRCVKSTSLLDANCEADIAGSGAYVCCKGCGCISPVGRKSASMHILLFQKNVPIKLLDQGVLILLVMWRYAIPCFVACFWDRNGGTGFQYPSRRSVGSNGSGQYEATLIRAALVFARQSEMKSTAAQVLL
jgi:hypothetical protein